MTRQPKTLHLVIAGLVVVLSLAASTVRARSAWASGGASRYTFSDSSCTKKEDPRNLRFDNINGQGYSAYNRATYSESPGNTVNFIGLQLWNGGVWHSDSWLYFNADGGCLPEFGDADSSWYSGWHMRDWMGNSNTGPIFGAAHHDFSCGSFNHSSDWWPWAAQKMANYFVSGFRDANTGKQDFTATKVHERPVTWHLQCNKVKQEDNGLTNVVTQTVPLVTFDLP